MNTTEKNLVTTKNYFKCTSIVFLSNCHILLDFCLLLYVGIEQETTIEALKIHQGGKPLDQVQSFRDTRIDEERASVHFEKEKVGGVQMEHYVTLLLCVSTVGFIGSL